MSATATPPPSRDLLPGAAVAAGIGLAGGLALPLASGVIPALLALAFALALARWRARATPVLTALAGLPRAHRWALAALLLAPMIPLATLAARTIAALVVAAPGALWIAGPAVLAALVLPRALGTWSYVPVLGVLVLGTAGAAAWGARFEAAGPHARGETWGGPILGIHPFQTTAIAIDGYGPFDLPINDYVEPDGSKGYGPAPLAEALERDLKKIAEQQFAAGPARAYRAFADATVVAETLPAARERLDRPAEQPTEPRLHVTSGGLGRRARVEFLCPGAPNDPRPRQPDSVMERMCPDKYVSEASAGLGVTGRWTGYVEAPGQARASLAGLLGWPRDRPRDELRLWAWLALALMIPAGWAAKGRAAAGLASWGGGVALAAAVLAILLVLPGFSGQVEAWSRAAAWESPWRVAPWVALLALGTGHATLAGGTARGTWARALPLVAGTLGLAGSLAAGAWLAPDLGPASEEGLGADARMLPAERLIAGLGEALAGATGIGLDTAEAVVAGAVIAALVGLLAALLGPGVRAAGILLGPARPIRAARLALLGVVVPAALLVLSRKTGGTAALLAPAAALAWLSGAALALAAGGSRRGLRIADLLASLVVVVAAGAQALAARDNDVMRLAVGVLWLAAAAALVLLRRPPRQ